MSRVVCINPPGSPDTTANREGAGGMGNVTPRVGAFVYPLHLLATVAGAFRESDAEVVARDSVLESDSIESAVTWVQAQNPQEVAVQVSWATQKADVAFLRALRQALPSAHVVAVGASVPMMKDALAQVEGIGRPADVEQAARLSYGHTVRPAWDLFQWRKYGMLSVVGSKGCDHACAYCPYRVVQGSRFEPRPVGDVVDELAWLSREFKPPRIVFRDPVFARDRQRVLEFCREMIRRGIRVAWECESRADDLGAETVHAMARAGCTAVKAGLESADPEVLVAVRRVNDAAAADMYLSRAEEVAAACRREGIAFRPFVMTGLPAETEPSIDVTAAFVEKLQPTALDVKELAWYPGTDVVPPSEEQAAIASARARRLREGWQPRQAARKSVLARVRRRLTR